MAARTSEETLLLARIEQIERAIEMSNKGSEVRHTADGQLILRGRVDALEDEVVQINVGATNDNAGHALLRGRVRRLEEAVGDMHGAHATMAQSLRDFALASLKIKRALAEVTNDLASL